MPTDRYGAIILDTNTIKAFHSYEVRQSLSGSLRSAGLVVWPTALSVLELIANPHPKARETRLAILAELSGTRHLLPLPFDLLRAAARSSVQNETGFYAPLSEIEHVFRDPTLISERQISRAQEYLRSFRQRWIELHDLSRAKVRARLQATDPWGSASAFLDDHWISRIKIDTLVETLWFGLGFMGAPPFDMLLSLEPWRLYFEGIGATVYEQCIQRQRPRSAHAPDVIQLVYVAGSSSRVFVTDDEPLYRVATAVLLGRYKGTRVLRSRELLALAP